MSADQTPTPIVDTFCRGLYDESCAAAADVPGCSATERSPEEAYYAAVELARTLERRNVALVEALINIEEYWNREPNQRAMEDALQHNIDTACAALAANKSEPT